MIGGCAHTSLAAGEPINGTAPHTTEWLLIEDRGSWPARPIDAPGIADLREQLEAWLATEGRRLILVRPDDESDARRVWLAEPATGRFARLDGSLADARWIDEPLDAPLLLVCAHGRRDACCGTLGAPLYADLQARGARVWKTSHLGGHRFAPTLLWLPVGYSFGRVPLDEAEALLAGIAEGALYDLDRVRGKVDLPHAAQAAELAARRAAGATRVDQVRHLGADGDTHRVQVDGDERTLTMRLETRDGERPKSCGKAPASIEVWVAC